MKFKLNKFAEEDDKSKKEAFDKKWNWTKYLFGYYTFGFENKNNKKINSKFLKVFCFLAIVFFILSMILSIYLISSGAYHQVITPRNLTMRGLGLVVPSINQDTFKDALNDSISISQGIPIENNRRDLIFIPIILFLPIIFIICSIHEFGHYIACRKAGIKVDEYGFGALSIFCIPLVPIGYVKPNEEELKKAKKYDYLSIVSSGVFMNVMGLFIFYLLLLLFPGKFFGYLLLFNFSVIILNVLPLGPLDGGLFINRLNKKVSYICSAIVWILLALIII